MSHLPGRDAVPNDSPRLHASMVRLFWTVLSQFIEKTSAARIVSFATSHLVRNAVSNRDVLRVRVVPSRFERLCPCLSHDIDLYVIGE